MASCGSLSLRASPALQRLQLQRIQVAPPPRQRRSAAAAASGRVAVPPPPPPPPPGSGAPQPSVSSTSLLTMGVVMGFQAAALIGAVVTGVLARRRRVETQTLNDKLRQINAELRRQREQQESILTAMGDMAAADQEPAGAASADTAAALEALRRQEELLQQERSLLEAALASPSAAHPTEGYGSERLSLAQTRRRIAQCIHASKELVRDGRPGDTFPLLAEGLQLARETKDLRAERALVRVRARAHRELGDPAAALQDLHRSMALSQQLGETTGDADTLGELADMYAELGDLETAGRFYDRCLEAIANEAPPQPLSSTWDAC